MGASNQSERIKRIVRPLYYKLYSLWLIGFGLLNPSRIKGFRKIPIIINNRNRLSALKELIGALERRGYFNIYIIDNNSSYPPLLDFYADCPYKVFRLKQNGGHKSFWVSGIYKQFYRDYYVYTDSDVVPVEECPDDFLELFFKTLKKDKTLVKIGLSLKIDDLPDHFKNKQAVLNWEKQFYENPVSDLFFKANVDTTFALYRPGAKHAANIYLKMYRAAFPYQARHLPWYIDSENIPEEEQYYASHASAKTHWTEVI